MTCRIRVLFLLSVCGSSACSGAFIVGDYDVTRGTGSGGAETSETTTGTGDPGIPDLVLAEPTHVFAAPHLLLPTTSTPGPRSMRAIDWDRDGDIDLFLCDGEGYIRYVERDKDGWRAAVSVRSQGRALRSALGRVELSLADGDGDGWPELWMLGDTSTLLRLRAIDPTVGVDFSEPSSMTLDLPEGSLGRVTVGDWDANGQLDLLAGGDDLGVWLLAGHTNHSGEFSFAPAQSLGELDLGSGARPRAQRLDDDDEPELVVVDDSGLARLGRRSFNFDGQRRPLTWDRLIPLQGPDGFALNLGQEQGSAASVELADFNGDGVLDLGVAGEAANVVVYPGRAYASLLDGVTANLATHANDLAGSLARDSELRASLAGDLVALRTAVELGLVPQGFVETIAAELSKNVTLYPQYFRRRAFNVDTEAYLPHVVAQLWITLLEALPAETAVRQGLADLLGFESGHRALLVDHGLLYIDNQQASPEQLAAVHRVMSIIPAELHEVNVVWAPEGLGLNDGMPDLSARGGVEIFASDIERTENLFPEDIEPRESGLYVGALAHQVNHFTLDRIGRRIRPQLYNRKFERLAELGKVNFVFKSPVTRGVDWAKTQAEFATRGYWDQSHETWEQALERYFATGPGQALAWSVPGGDAKLVLTQPDEPFATVAGQYFADSRHLLRLSVERFDRGYALNLELFLDVVDYYADGGQTSFFFAADSSLYLQRERVHLARDAAGRIVQLGLSATPDDSATTIHFERDGSGRLVGWGQRAQPVTKPTTSRDSCRTNCR